MNANESNDANQKPCFMDLFALHLGVQLLGKNRVLKHFKATETFRVYWRTPLLQQGTACHSCAATTASETSDWGPLFLDVTLDFDRASKMSTCFGLLLRKSTSVVYMKANAQNLSQLASHAEIVGIDLDSTAPDAMARTMGKALSVLAKGATAKLKGSDGNDVTELPEDSSSVTASIQLDYQDLQETSPLVLTSETVSMLDCSTADMMLSNLIQQDQLVVDARQSGSSETDKAAVDSSDGSSAEVSKAFETWLNASTATVDDNTETVTSTTEGTINGKLNGGGEGIVSSSDKEGLTTATGTTEMPPQSSGGPDQSQARSKRKQPRFTGYARVPTAKRKKKGKLTFAKVD